MFSFGTSQQLLDPVALLIPFVLAAEPKYWRLGFLLFDVVRVIFVCFIFFIFHSFTQHSQGCWFFRCWMIVMRSFLLFLLGEVGLWTTFLVGMKAFFQSIYFLLLILFLSLSALRRLALKFSCLLGFGLLQCYCNTCHFSSFRWNFASDNLKFFQWWTYCFDWWRVPSFSLSSSQKILGYRLLWGRSLHHQTYKFEGSVQHPFWSKFNAKKGGYRLLFIAFWGYWVY